MRGKHQARTTRKRNKMASSLPSPSYQCHCESTLSSRAAPTRAYGVLSRPAPETLDLAPGCGLGDPSGVYGRDIICVVEYGEVLLMDQSGTEILRALAKLERLP